jgi:hypothetical protein
VRGIDATVVPFRVGDFEFANTPVNEPLVPNLATATFVAKQCNGAFGGGTGTEKALIRNGTRDLFFVRTGMALSWIGFTRLLGYVVKNP